MSRELEQRIYMNQLRRRSEQAVHSRPALVGRLTSKAGVAAADVRFVDLEQSDALARAAFSRRNGRSPDITWRHGAELHVARTLADIASRVGSTSAYLIGHQEADTAGAALLPVASLLQNLFRYWEPEQEDIVLVSADADDGLFLEWDDCIGFELTTWGRFERALTAPH